MKFNIILAILTVVIVWIRLRIYYGIIVETESYFFLQNSDCNIKHRYVIGNNFIDCRKRINTNFLKMGKTLYKQEHCLSFQSYLL